MAVGNIDALPFVPAVHRRQRTSEIQLIVLHSGETNEGSTAAEGMASFFASGNTIGSAHICVDNDSGVRCASDSERCNGAGGVNDNGLHLEQAGRAGQTEGDWLDDYSRSVVENAADVTRQWIAKHPQIRPVFLTAAQLAAGERYGITTHAQVSQVFAGNDGHWDPGPNYPINFFMDLVRGGPAEPVVDPRAIAIERERNRGKTVNAFEYGDSEIAVAVEKDGSLVAHYTDVAGHRVRRVLSGPQAERSGGKLLQGYTSTKAEGDVAWVPGGFGQPFRLDFYAAQADGHGKVHAWTDGGGGTKAVWHSEDWT